MQASTSWDDVAFSSTEGDRHLGIRPVSQLNTWPVVSPCERFTAALASRTSCITRGRGGWLDLPRGGLAPPILCQLPGALRVWSKSEVAALRRDVCFAPDCVEKVLFALRTIFLKAAGALGVWGRGGITRSRADLTSALSQLLGEFY